MSESVLPSHYYVLSNVIKTLEKQESLDKRQIELLLFDLAYVRQGVLGNPETKSAPNLVHAMDAQALQELGVLLQNQRTQDAQDLHDFRCAALQGFIAMQAGFLRPKDAPSADNMWRADQVADDVEAYAQAMLKKAKESDHESN